MSMFLCRVKGVLALCMMLSGCGSYLFLVNDPRPSARAGSAMAFVSKSGAGFLSESGARYSLRRVELGSRFVSRRAIHIDVDKVCSEEEVVVAIHSEVQPIFALLTFGFVRLYSVSIYCGLANEAFETGKH